MGAPVVNPTGNTVRMLQVIETDLERRGDGTKDDPIRRVVQYWSTDGQLLAERDDTAPTHCNAIGHRIMHGADRCDHCGARLVEIARAAGIGGT